MINDGVEFTDAGDMLEKMAKMMMEGDLHHTDNNALLLIEAATEWRRYKAHAERVSRKVDNLVKDRNGWMMAAFGCIFIVGFALLLAILYHGSHL